jgi:hypothetical protein
MASDTGRPPGLMNVDCFLLPKVSSKIRGVGNGQHFQPIYFQFLPELSGDEESANYDDIGGDIIGRAEGFSIYKNGKNREITLKTQFAAWDETYNEIWVMQQVFKIKALTKPIYGRNSLQSGKKTFYAPPLCLFSYGNRYINIPVVITDVSAVANADAAITVLDAMPTVMDVEITMKTNYPYGYVPGYLNYVNAFTAVEKGNSTINPQYMDWNGSSTTTSPSKGSRINAIDVSNAPINSNTKIEVVP